MESEKTLSVNSKLTPEQIELIKNNIAVGATNDELALFISVCERTGLDPFARQIYAIRRRHKDASGKMVDTLKPEISIDGFRAIADRTDCYAGNDDPIFDNEEHPTKATVTVYKIIQGVRCPFAASARWSQYYPGEGRGFMWDKMPHLMLGKVAESLALRKAFPSQLSGLYTPEEMAQAPDSKPIDVTPKNIPMLNEKGEVLIEAEGTGKPKGQHPVDKLSDLTQEQKALHLDIVDKLFNLCGTNAKDMEDCLEMCSALIDPTTHEVKKPGAKTPLALNYSKVGRAPRSQAEFTLNNLSNLTKEIVQNELAIWRDR